MEWTELKYYMETELMASFCGESKQKRDKIGYIDIKNKLWFFMAFILMKSMLYKIKHLTKLQGMQKSDVQI